MGLADVVAVLRADTAPRAARQRKHSRRPWVPFSLPGAPVRSARQTRTPPQLAQVARNRAPWGECQAIGLP